MSYTVSSDLRSFELGQPQNQQQQQVLLVEEDEMRSVCGSDDDRGNYTFQAESKQPVASYHGPTSYVVSAIASSPATILEEKIEEEITTTFIDGGEDPTGLAPRPGSSTGSVSTTNSTSSRQRLMASGGSGPGSCNYFVEMNLHDPPLRVPFPELGLDVVDINMRPLLSTDELKGEGMESGIRLTYLKSWEENWLFQKKRKTSNSVCPQYAFTELDLAAGPVRMFIPNPSPRVETRIGSLDVDQLSEFSERNSVGSSLSFSSDPPSDIEEEDANTTTLVVADQVKIRSAKPRDNNSNNATVITIAASEAPATDEDDEAFVDVEILPSPEGQTKQLLCPSPAALLLSPRSSESEEEKRQKKVTTPAKTTNDSDNNQQKHQEKNSREKVVIVQRSLSCVSSNSRRIASGHHHYLLSPQDKQPLVVPKFVPIAKRMESARTDPVFVVKPCGASVQTDILVQFPCRVKGTRPLRVAWFKDDLQLNDDDTFRVFSCGSEYVLEIKSTKLELSDTYSCVVYNHQGEEWSDFDLQVKQVRERPRASPLARHAVKEADFVHHARGIAVRLGDAPKFSPPVVIQRTWAERVAELQENEGGDVRSEGESAPASSASRPRGCDLRQVDEGSMMMKATMATTPCFPIADQEKAKWENSPVAWPENPYTEEGAVRRKERPVIYSSEESSGFNSLQATPATNTLTGSVGPTPDPMDSGDVGVAEEKSSPISTLTKTASKDLSRHKRDYYVPSDCQTTRRAETFNGLEEKQVFQIYSMKGKEETGLLGNNNGYCHATKGNFPKRSSGSLNSRISEDYDLPDEGRDEGQEDQEEEYADGGDQSKELSSPSGTSVRNLIQKFSQGSKLRRSSTFSSTRTVHDDCNGKGVVPRMTNSSHFNGRSFEVPFVLNPWVARNGYSSSVDSDCDEYYHYYNITNCNSDACSSITRTISDGYLSLLGSPALGEQSTNVHSLTARSLKKEFREQTQRNLPRVLNRLGSVSMFDIDQVTDGHSQRSSSPGTGTTATCSPTNAGYASDESNSSGTGTALSGHSGHGQHRTVLQVKGGNQQRKGGSRAIMKRASFWQKRCEHGLLSDSSVNEDFPPPECLPYD